MVVTCLYCGHHTRRRAPQPRRGGSQDGRALPLRRLSGHHCIVCIGVAESSRECFCSRPRTHRRCLTARECSTLAREAIGYLGLTPRLLLSILLGPKGSRRPWWPPSRVPQKADGAPRRSFTKMASLRTLSAGYACVRWAPSDTTYSNARPAVTPWSLSAPSPSEERPSRRPTTLSSASGCQCVRNVVALRHEPRSGLEFLQ